MISKRSVPVIAAMTLATAVGVVWLAIPGLPSGVSGEWTWSRMPWTAAHPYAWMVGLVAAALSLGSVALITRVLSSDPDVPTSWLRRAVCSLLVISIAAGMWLTLLNALPSLYGLTRAPLVLFYPRMTGYYTAARNSNDGAKTFLHGYERMLRDLKGTDRYLHIGTHPPGLILLNRGFLAATAASPELVRWLDATAPEQFRDGMSVIAGEPVGSPRAPKPTDAATLWLATLFTLLATAACIPLLAMLLRAAGHSEASALRWASLWMFTPAIAVFFPKDDVLFAFPALLAGVLWVRALQLSSRWRAVAAGAVCCAGLFFTLAFLPVLAWLALATIGAWWKEDRETSHDDPRQKTVRPRAAALAAGLFGLLIPLFILLAAFEMNLPTIWRLNFENHAEFYQHNARSYGAWLFANLGELALAAGPAVCILALTGLLPIRRAGGISPLMPPHANTLQPTIAGPRWTTLGISGLIVIGLLWISGKNMGEAARLWMPFFPWLLLCIPATSAPPAPLTDSERRCSASLWWATASLQAVACLAAATRIDGFGFSELK